MSGQRTLNQRLADLEPQVALLDDISMEQSRRLSTESCGWPRTLSMRKAEGETENSDEELDATNMTSPATKRIACPQSPQCGQRQLNEPISPRRSKMPPRSQGGTPRKSKQHRPTQLEEVANSPKEVREMREWTRSHQSLEEALFASLKATRDQPNAHRVRAATPDWPERAKVLTSQVKRNSSENHRFHTRSPASKTRPDSSSSSAQTHKEGRDDAPQCSTKKDRDATSGFATPPPVSHKILTRRMLSA
jgi:hypothetical protein